MNKYVATALCIALLTGSAATVWITHRVDVMSRKTEELTATTQQTMTRVYEYADWQLTDFQSPAYQKRLQATVATGAYIGSMAKSFNVRVIPEIVGLLQDARANNLPSLNRLTLTANDFTQSLAVLAKDTNASMNGTDGLLPQMSKLAGSLNTTVNDLNADLKTALEAGLTTMETIRTVVSNPRVNTFLDETTGAMTNLKLTIGHVEEGMREFPTLVKLYEKYSKTATRWQRIIYLAQIVNLLGGLPRP